MSTYSQLRVLPTARRNPSGSAVRIVIVRVDTGQPIFIGQTTGISATDNFEQNPVEEAGEDGVNEFSTGRHTGQANVQGHFRLETNEKLPGRVNFLGDGLGMEFLIYEQMGDKRQGQGVPINVFEGCVISSYGHQVGARGVVTYSLSFAYRTRYNGKEWADLNGDPDYAS